MQAERNLSSLNLLLVMVFTVSVESLRHLLMIFFFFVVVLVSHCEPAGKACPGFSEAGVIGLINFFTSSLAGVVS